MKLEWLLSWILSLVVLAISGLLRLLTFGLSCCTVEMMHTTISRYDMDKLSIIFRASSRHYDLITLASTLISCLRILYEQITKSKWILSMSSFDDCSEYHRYSYSVSKSCDKIIPVDTYVLVCNPTSEAPLFKSTQPQGKIDFTLSSLNPSSRMVQKWSYIDNSINCYHVNPRFNMKRFNKRHSFKVFKKTTKFKKYKLGLTKFVKKYYSRKKRKTSWYMNSHILFTWTYHYMKQRQFVRFTQAYGLVPIHGYLGNADFAIKNSLFVGAEYGFNAYSCSSKILNKSVFFKNDIFKNKAIAFDSRNSFVQFVDYESSSNSNEIGTNLMFFDKLCYPFDLEKPFDMNHIDFLNDLENTIFKISLDSVVEFRKIVVLLTLLIIKK